MKVLQINYSDISGGAAIASYRLHQGLLEQEVDSKMLVESKKTSSDRVAIINRLRSPENLMSRLAWRLGLNNISVINSFNFPNHPLYQESEIINFHNLHGDYFNYLALATLTKNKSAVWTLHDMWSFTGHCAYSYDCDRWKIGCGKCPYLDTIPSTGFDNTRLEWRLKKWVYNRSSLTIVCPSKWLTEQAKKSIFKDFIVEHIPYGIDTQAYQPLEQQKCQSVLGIPNNKKVLMFVAQSLSDRRKGGDLLIDALNKLPESLKKATILITLGEGGEIIGDTVGIPVINLGYVSGDLLKSIAYSAADLFIVPTRADNLPLVLQESMACGTPMISFNVGGVPDLVRPGVTGCLAEPDNAQDFGQKIIELLENSELREKMAKNCRNIAVEEYPLKLQAQRYIKLYSQILGN
ncbi:MAG TPA: glycosyl transferase [Cyanothece sp. UBA12306]|nr:glycosyl transferase [Cyanothece sp. UBA12306]